VDPQRLMAFVRERPGSGFSPTRVLSFPAPAGEGLLPALIGLLPEFAAA
jgi:hypothetical protein